MQATRQEEEEEEEEKEEEKEEEEEAQQKLSILMKKLCVCHVCPSYAHRRIAGCIKPLPKAL